MDYESLMFLISIVFVLIGSFSINKSLKTKSSFILLLTIIVYFIGSLSFSFIVSGFIRYYGFDNIPIAVKYLYGFDKEIFPVIMTFLSSLSFLCVAKNIKSISNDNGAKSLKTGNDDSGADH